MIFTVFIVFFPLEQLRRGHTAPVDCAITLAVVFATVALTASAIVSWQRRLPFLWIPVAFGAIGFVLAQYSYMSPLFFLYAAALAPWALRGDIHRSITVGVLLVLAEILQLLLEPNAFVKSLWAIEVPIFTIGNIAAGLWIARMRMSLRRLARVAVRERITHELHEVLGSALASIASRSALATRLLSENAALERAARAIADIESVSRLALADVRQTIRRYRSDVPEAHVQRASDRIDWRPMLGTLYIVFLPVGFWRGGGGSEVEWGLVWSGVLVFLALIAVAIVAWQRREPFALLIFPMTFLAIGFAQRTPSAAVMLIFAAALAPCAMSGNVFRTVRIIAALIAIEVLIGVRNVSSHPQDTLAFREWWWVTVPLITSVAAVAALWGVRMSLRHLELARVNERERIARDLHDVLGHTLSLIALKSELAGRLLTQRQNVTDACSEMMDVERISAQALGDVRTTILGDRNDTLDAEFERARATLRTAGIAVECEREAVTLGSMHEGILGLALREAVTNIVRHARASSCSIRLQQQYDAYVLEVQDDGRGGGTEGEGFGLRGMRERIEALGGSVLRDMSSGTRLTVRLPAPPPRRADRGLTNITLRA